MIRLTEKDCDDLTLLPSGEMLVRQRYGIGLPQLREAALNENIEQCPSCRWWCEAGELVNDDGVVDGKCGNCR